jgi:hypothetical protein
MNGCRPIYTAGWNDERKLLMKMVEVYKQVQYIQKRGHNKFHNYKYATEADVNEKVREELSTRNIIMMPGVVNKELRNTTTKSGNTEYIYRVDMEFNFMDAETGENLVVPMSGEGQDVGDKAIFKAISGCQKYALMKAFMIPTGDDPEGDEGVDERNHQVSSTPPRTTQQPTQTNTQTSQQSASQQPQGSVAMVSDAQVGFIKKLVKEKEVSDDDYRQMIAPKTSTKDLTKTEASKLIETLNKLVLEPVYSDQDLPF